MKIINHFISIFILNSLVIFATFGKVLSDEDIKNCKKIAIIAGTYDPFTNGHKIMGREITNRLPFDCVVYLPTQDPPHKIASPFMTRYEMLEAALEDHPNFFYPSKEDLLLSPKDFVKKLKEMGHQKEVFAVLGSDLSPQNKMYYINEFRLGPDGYIITGRGNEQIEVAKAFSKKTYHVLEIDESYSSTQARKWFIENDDVYFKTDVPEERYPNKILDPKVSNYIKNNGIYFGTNGQTTRSVFRIVFSPFISFLNESGIFHHIRDIAVKKHKIDNLTEIQIGEKKYPLKKHLGSGLTADAYVFNFDGRDHVIKIANKRLKSPSSIIQDVKIGQWLNYKTSIRVPEVQAVDPEGKWKITTFVGGESLGEYLANRNGFIEPHIKQQLELAVDDMVKLSEKTNTKLDLSVDNIKIWNEKVYLIDAGPIPPDLKHPRNFVEFTKSWSKQAKVNINNECSNALKAFMINQKIPHL